MKSRARCLTHRRFSVNEYYGFYLIVRLLFLASSWFLLFFPSLSEEQGSYVPSVLYAHLLWPFSPLRNGHRGFCKGLNWWNWLERPINPSFSDWIQGKREKQCALKGATPSRQQEYLHPWNGIKFYAGNSYSLPPPARNGLLKRRLKVFHLSILID